MAIQTFGRADSWYATTMTTGTLGSYLPKYAKYEVTAISTTNVLTGSDFYMGSGCDITMSLSSYDNFPEYPASAPHFSSFHNLQAWMMNNFWMDVPFFIFLPPPPALYNLEPTRYRKIYSFFRQRPKSHRLQ